MAVKPLTSGPISLTYNIKFHIIRNKAGLNFGHNINNAADPRTITTLSQLFGFAGLDSTKYSAFIGYNLNESFIELDTPIGNGQEVYFIHNNLLHIPSHLLLQ